MGSRQIRKKKSDSSNCWFPLLFQFLFSSQRQDKKKCIVWKHWKKKLRFVTFVFIWKQRSHYSHKVMIGLYWMATVLCALIVFIDSWWHYSNACLLILKATVTIETFIFWFGSTATPRNLHVGLFTASSPTSNSILRKSRANFSRNRLGVYFRIWIRNFKTFFIPYRYHFKDIAYKSDSFYTI